MPPKRKASALVEPIAKRVQSTSSPIRSVDHKRRKYGFRAKPAATTMDQATIENQIMPPQRKAAAADKRYAKRVPSTRSRFWRIGHQKQQYKSRATSTAATMDQAPTDRKTQQVVQGPSASSSAQPELLYSRELANICNEVHNYQRCKERRIILIGKTGTGKSTLGNALLGYNCFETKGFPMQSTTSHCKVGQTKSKDGKNIVVLDTPGLKDTKQEPAKIKEELCKCTAMTAPGPHAVCLVIGGNARFTQENIDTLNEFCDFFGEDLYKYVIVVFTHKTSMGKSSTTDDGLYALPSEFVSKFLKAGGKKIAIESKAKKEDLKKQINELFKLIEELIEKNDGSYYSEKTFKVAEEAFRKRIPKIHQEVKKQFEEKKKLLKNDFKEKEKRFEEEKTELTKKLQEKKEKCMQLKEKEKHGKVARAAQIKRLEAKHQKTIKSLEKKMEKIKEEYEQKIEGINKEGREYLFDKIIEDRSKLREAVPERQGFNEVVRRAVGDGAVSAYDAARGWIENAIGAMAGWIRR